MVGICPRCEKEISTIRKIEWTWFAPCLALGIVLIVSQGLSLASLLLGIIPPLIYVFYHFTKAPKTCPICGYSNIFDEGRELNKKRISYLKDRLLYLDKTLKNPKKIGQQERAKFTQEIREVAEELQKYGYDGVVEETHFFKRKQKDT